MFVHLHTHSHYSFLRAVPRPEEIVAAAAEQAHQLSGEQKGAERAAALPESLCGGAVALTDTNGLYAAVPFCRAAREAGVKPIVGTVLDFAFVGAGLSPPGDQKETSRGAACCAPTTVVLLAANLTGYSNLCRLVTQRHIDEKPASLESLNAHREGLIALYPVCSHKREASGALGIMAGRGFSPAEIEPSSYSLPEAAAGTAVSGSKNLKECSYGTAKAVPYRNPTVAALKDMFGAALYLEVQNLGPGDRRALREAVRISREMGIPIAATNNVHFLRREEHLHHRVLNAIRFGSLLTKIAPPEITTAEAYFKSPAEMQRAFPDHPEALRATLEIAERCNLDLPLGKTIFPEFPVPAGETPFSYLWKLCFDGARRRYRPPTPEVLARLTHELHVIEKLHLAPYFLLVWDIAEEARRRGIPAVARGSAASSIVTYCLGISRVCPLRWGLYFERFLNEQRGDIPDIDLDICGARRDELLDYVYQRWGHEHVAMIASFVTMHARLAVREVAKVFGLSPGEVNHFTRRLPHRPVREIMEAIRTLPECRNLPAQEEPWKAILDVALRLDDFPRHLGIHPCGTVIAARPLTELVPLEWATKGIVVTQYDMNAVEALGLIKMDLLGQRGLTTMSLALANIESSVVGAQHAAPLQAGGTSPAEAMPCHTSRSIDFDAIPEGDPLTCEMIARGRTMGIFQIESPGMRGLERALGGHRSNGKSPSGAKAPDSCNPNVAAKAATHKTGSGHRNLVSAEEEPAWSADALEALKGRKKIARGVSPGNEGPREARPSLPQADAEGEGPQRLSAAKPSFTLEDICLALALIRPGAAEYGSKESFLRRLRGREPVRYPHPSVAPILRETLGTCVYQEQVMQLAQAGGLSLAEADLVRRSSAKFADRRERERLHSKYLKSAERLGLSGEAREQTWHMVEKFAGFGFCKAHAATYADLSYRMAYLKAHYPAEFLAAMCSSGAGFYHVSAYVEEAKRWGIEVRLPSVNHSRLEYTTEPVNPPLGGRTFRSDNNLATLELLALATEGSSGAKALERESAYMSELKLRPPTSAMRIGLMQVKGLRVETIRAIVRSREEHGPYRSLEDFLARVAVERDEIESLIKCGAFDEIGEGETGGRTDEVGGHGFSRAVSATHNEGALAPEEPQEGEASPAPTTGNQDSGATRPALLWRLNLAGMHTTTASPDALLFPETAQREAAAIPALPDYTRAQRLAFEQEILEVTVSGHPLDLVQRNGEVWSTDVMRAVELCGARLQPRRRPAPAYPPSGDLAPAIYVGQRVTLLGWVITFRHVGTKNYRNMMFVTLEDQRGVYEVVLFPEAYERYGGLVFETRALRVTGRVEPDGQINGDKMERIELRR